MASSLEYKLVVLGGGRVGKSSMTIQLINHHFVDACYPTFEENYRKQVKLDSEICLLDILDPADSEVYSATRDNYIRTGDGFIVVYSITSRSSFEEVSVIVDFVRRYKDVDYLPMVLVGNKCDLEDAREVSTEEGKELAKLLGGAPFLESSAKNRINIDEAFHAAVNEVRESRGGYVNVSKMVTDQVVLLILLANRFGKSSLGKIDVNVMRLIARNVYESRSDKELWKTLIERERSKKRPPKCVIQ